MFALSFALSYSKEQFKRMEILGQVNFDNFLLDFLYSLI